jgi:hypothetical protein
MRDLPGSQAGTPEFGRHGPRGRVARLEGPKRRETAGASEPAPRQRRPVPTPVRHPAAALHSSLVRKEPPNPRTPALDPPRALNGAARRVVPFVLLTLLSSVSVLPQDSNVPPISPDRPDLTNGTDIVPLGMLQLESGVSFATVGDQTTIGLGELNFRLPLARWLEVTLQSVGMEREGRREESVWGFTDSATGCKIRLLAGHPTAAGTSPRVALLLLTSLPTGSGGFHDPRLQPHATLAMDLDLTSSVSLSTNVGIKRATDVGEHYIQAFGGLSLGFAIGGPWAGFLEVFAYRPGSAGGTTRSVVDGGVQLLLGNNVMLDGRVGRGTGDGPLGTFGGLGISFRW